MKASAAGGESRQHDKQEDDDGESSRFAFAHQAALDLLSEWRHERLLRAEDDDDGNGVPTASLSPSIDAWQLYRLGYLLAQLRDHHRGGGGGGGGSSNHTNGSRARLASTSLREAAHDLLAAMPAGDRRDAFRLLHLGLFRLVQKVPREANDLPVPSAPAEPSGGLTEDERNVEEAISVLSELYAVAGDNAPTAADFRRSGGDTWFQDPSPASGLSDQGEADPALHLLLSFYVNVVVFHKRAKANEAMLRILTRLAWTDQPDVDVADDDGDHVSDNNRSDPAMFSVLRTIQAFETAWCEFVRHQDVRDESWRQALLHQYHDDDLDEDQLAYLSSILHALTTDDDDGAARSSSKASSQGHPAAAIATAADTSPRASRESELDRRIRQVRQILPDLGEGFVEAALSYYQGDVERTVTTLLQEADGSTDGAGAGTGLPEALRSLDWSLPRRARRRRSDSRPEADEVVIAITKSIVRETDRLMEEEAYALQRVGGEEFDDDVDDDSPRAAFRNEYDDDYDDQYDDYQPTVDDKADANDYEAIRLYNRALKSVEREQVYWEEERNTNRGVGRSEEGGADGAPKYRGPDKLRGGRIPREHRIGGGGTRGQGNPHINVTGRAPRGRGQTEARQPDGVDGQGGRGRGRGGARGGHGGGARGQRDGQGGRAASSSNDTTAPDSGAQSRPGAGSRAKANRLANRRDKQKQAAAKRVG